MSKLTNENKKNILSFRSPKPLFNFPEMDGVDGFSFEKLSADNFEILHKLFSDDENVFTDARFKQYESAKEYAAFQQEWGAYMPKHGGQDWYFKQNGEYIGILHLYDLSLETFAKNNQKCWVGFAITPAWRNRGIMKKVLRLFIQYVFNKYSNINYVHAMTLPDNIASIGTLLSAGFEEDDMLLVTDKYKAFTLERTNAIYKTDIPITFNI